MPRQRATRGRKWNLGIVKVDGRWMVQKPATKVHRGLDPTRDKANRESDSVVWTLYPDPDDPGKAISAHFQFAHRDLFKGLPGRRDLTRDLTAVIKAPRGTLQLKLQKHACRRKNPRYYAVWIRDETLPRGGVYAVGASGNPPPEMQVGP